MPTLVRLIRSSVLFHSICNEQNRAKIRPVNNNTDTHHKKTKTKQTKTKYSVENTKGETRFQVEKMSD